MQKYPHIIEPFFCNRKIFAFIFLFPINSLISSGIYSTRNCQNKQFHFCYKIKQSNVGLHLYPHQDLLHVPHPLFF